MPCSVASTLAAAERRLAAWPRLSPHLCATALAAAVGAGSAPEPNPATAPNGLGIAATCMTCHHPSNTHVPWVERPSAALIRAQADAGGTVMHRFVRGLTDAEIEAVAAALATAPEG